jgi:malic enzyme
MFLAAAERLAKEVTREDLLVGSVFPKTIDKLSDVARAVGVAVAERAEKDGVARIEPGGNAFFGV